MQSVTDTNNNPLTVVPVVLTEGAESPVIVARVPCTAGMYLAASGDGRAEVLARQTGSGDPFVDISDAPISLTEFDGNVVSFDFKVVAKEISRGIERVALAVRVTYQP
jgi:hypothetical protein